MIFISAIIISQWSTEEQNKGHWFCISWSLWNPLFPSLWACPVGLLQETLQMNTKPDSPEWPICAHSFPRPKTSAIPSPRPSQHWRKPSLNPSSREEACFTSFIKQDIHRNGPVNFCVVKLTSHEQSHWFYLRILHLHRCKNQPHLRFPSFHDGGQAEDPWRPLQIN